MWRIGSKVPLNVYDGDRPVCQCHSAEDAAKIVAAVNGAASVRAKTLREAAEMICPHCADKVPIGQVQDLDYNEYEAHVWVYGGSKECQADKLRLAAEQAEKEASDLQKG